MSRGKKITADRVDYYANLALSRGGTVTGHGPVEPPPPEAIDDAADEKAFQKEVTALAEKNGWDWHHHTDSRKSKAGWPDLVLFHPHPPRILFRELKTETGRLSPDQERFRDIIVAGGGDWGLWRPSDLPTIIATLEGQSP